MRAFSGGQAELRATGLDLHAEADDGHLRLGAAEGVAAVPVADAVGEIAFCSPYQPPSAVAAVVSQPALNEIDFLPSTNLVEQVERPLP